MFRECALRTRESSSDKYWGTSPFKHLKSLVLLNFFFHETTIMLIGCRRSSPKSITFAAFGGIWLRRHASWLVLTGSRCDVRLETLCGWIEYTLRARLSPLSQQLQISKISRDLCSRCVVVDGLAEFRSQHCYESFSRAALFL